MKGFESAKKLDFAEGCAGVYPFLQARFKQIRRLGVELLVPEPFGGKIQGCASSLMVPDDLVRGCNRSSGTLRGSDGGQGYAVADRRGRLNHLR